MKAPLRVFTGLTLLLGGCIANNFFLELIIRCDSVLWLWQWSGRVFTTMCELL